MECAAVDLTIWQHFVEQKVDRKQVLWLFEKLLTDPLLTADLTQAVLGIFAQSSAVCATFQPAAAAIRQINKQINSARTQTDTFHFRNYTQFMASGRKGRKSIQASSYVCSSPTHEQSGKNKSKKSKTLRQIYAEAYSTKGKNKVATVDDRKSAQKAAEKTISCSLLLKVCGTGIATTLRK